MKNVVKVRAIISSLLLIAFAVTLFTGVGLYFAPIGRVAQLTQWSFLGLKKMQLEKLHTVSSFSMSFLVMIHLSLNYKLFFNEVKMLFKK